MKILLPVATELEKATKDGLREAGRQILKRARDLSPTDTGESDKSGFTRVDDLTLQVGFASFISRLNHENLDRQFPSGGQAKFLETAASEVDVGAIVAAKVRANLG